MSIHLSNYQAPTNTAASHPANSQEIARSTDAAIFQVKERVMAIIRNHMPITTLFNPELKINLELFIESQLFIQKIAAFLASLPKSVLNQTQIAEQFEKSDLFPTIKRMCNDSLSCQQIFYQACADVLNQKVLSNDIKPAIEGRIFTLKNALFAQDCPKDIINLQLKYGIRPQTESQIQQEGAAFIRQCLQLYLNSHHQEEKSFKMQLAATARQLIPFVEQVTLSYLKENKEACSEDILRFRNPTGYNHHGRMAASVMETCLNVLGYKTQLVGRSDLDPRVTLATAHNIVEVIGPDRTRYIVDPTYLQFHQDICLEASQLPKEPILIIAEDEVEQYVENTLMKEWRKNAALVNHKNMVAINKLEKQDQMITFIIHQRNLPAILVPRNVEQWVKTSLMKVWDLRSYRPIFLDDGFQNIFTNETATKKTHAYVQAMGIGPLSHRLPYSEVKTKLNALLNNPGLKGKNSSDALSLIAQVPLEDRENYTSLLDADPRIKGIDITLTAYFRSLRKIVNPKREDKHVIYGCSGADCATVMLATDAKTFTFIDTTPLSYELFQKAVTLIKNNMPSLKTVIEQILNMGINFTDTRFRFGGTSSVIQNGAHVMENLELKLIYDLYDAGVDLSQLALSQDEAAISLEFPWQYQGEPSSRMRKITLVAADLTKPEAYPDILKNKIKEGFDIFYMKAAFTAPQSYPQFLPFLAKSMRTGGWLMTIDKTAIMEEFNPDECLRQNQLAFTSYKSEETDIIENIIHSPTNKFSNVPTLDDTPKERRIVRRIGSDASYWSLLNLRQKS